MPKEEQNRKRWIAKIQRDVGPYFKVTVFFFNFAFVCVFVCVFLNSIYGLAFMFIICMT